MDPQNRLICMTPLTPLQSLDGYQDFSQQEAVDSRPESAPPSVELQMEPSFPDPQTQPQMSYQGSGSRRSPIPGMMMYDEYGMGANNMGETVDPYMQRGGFGISDMQGSMGSEMEDPRNASLAMKSPMAMAPADVETDPIISHPVRINNSTTADPYYLNSQYVNTPYNNIVDEEIRNSSKSAPVAYREDYFRYPYYNTYYDRGMMAPTYDEYSNFDDSYGYNNIYATTGSHPYGSVINTTRNRYRVMQSPSLYASSSPNPMGNTSMNPISMGPSAYKKNGNNYIPSYPSTSGSMSAHSSSTPAPPLSMSSANNMEMNSLHMKSNHLEYIMRSRDDEIRMEPSVMNHRSRPPPQNPNWIREAIESYRGHIFEMSKDQKGCRLLQQCLDDGSSMIVETIYAEVEDHLIDLMHDSFGNYLFQKLLDNTNDEQRRQILSKVYSYIVQASMDVHGTRSVQKIIQTCRQPDMVQLIMNAIRDHIATLSSDSNGNHVIQRCLQYMPLESKAEIYEQVIQHCFDIATHRHGCCVVQRCLDSSPIPYHDRLLDEIIKYSVKLMQNPFGNYVVQYLIENGQLQESQRLIQCVLGHVEQLSKQKYSSNVIEKSLKFSTEELRGKIIEELANSDQLRELLHQDYANYVIQKALLLGSKEQRLMLLRAIAPFRQDLTRSTGGRHILARLQDVPELN